MACYAGSGTYGSGPVRIDVREISETVSILRGTVLNAESSSLSTSAERNGFALCRQTGVYGGLFFYVRLLTIKCLLFIMCILKQHTKERRAELCENTYIKFL